MSHFPELKGKKVLLVSHSLTVTGAPMLLAETGVQMVQSGARVALTNLGERDLVFPFPESDGFEEVSIEDSFDFADSADLIVANTAVAKTWVDELLIRQPEAASKTVWWIHEIDMEEYGGGMENLAKVSFAVFDSHFCLRQWQQSSLTPARAITIHPGVPEKFYETARRLTTPTWGQRIKSLLAGNGKTDRDQIRSSLGITSQDFLLVCIAQYCTLKGQNLLTQAVGNMLADSPDSPLKLLLVGFRDDAEKDNFLSRRTANELRALGSQRVINRIADPLPYYFAGDAFVLNTQLPGETFGLVLIEAMTFGLPVLATSTGGSQEIIIDGETGLHHPPGPEGEAKLIENIQTLMNDSKLAKRLGKAGRERVQTDFRADRFYRDYARVLSQVMSPAS